MLTLKSKFLAVRELPAADPYPPAALVSVLDGTDTLHVIGNQSVLAELAEAQPLDEIELELRWRRVDLASLGGGGKGKAYRLKVARVLEAGSLARALKRQRENEVARGAFVPTGKLTFQDYAREWIGGYNGKRKGIRERTKADYLRDLEAYAFRFFDERKRLTAINTRDADAFIAWLATRSRGRSRGWPASRRR